jgi:WD40 repeat protein/tetratricopeptide (TPR) repeat protein
MASCPPAEQLEQFLREELPRASSEELEGHLSACASCRRRLEELTLDNPARKIRQIYQAIRAAAADPELRFLRDFPSSFWQAAEQAPQGADTPPTSSEAVPVEKPLLKVPGYEILGELGRGGMGVVFKARQVALKRLVALKMILAGHLAGPEHRRRFLVEAEALARLRHPNIVQVYEVDTHDSWPFFALEYVDGGTLADRLREGPLPPNLAAAFVETLARAIHVAHFQGIIHRDLKPANILLQKDEGNTPKITDFGLAKVAEGHPGLTRTGVVAGTPQYMAPEQAAGSKTLTPAVDVYALGAILYQALTGRAPFDGQDAVRIVARLASGETPSLSGAARRLPRDLVTICTRCLEREPGRRYASAEALADDLRRYLRGEPIQARPIGELERLWKWARRHKALAAALAAVTLILAAGTAVSTYFAVVANRRAGEAQQKEADAQTARREAEDQAARADFARGYDLATQGDGARGLHTMLAALRRTPAKDAAFQRVLRTNVAAWSVPLFNLRHVINGTGTTPLGLVFRPDDGAFAVLLDDGVQQYATASGEAIGGRLGGAQLRCLTYSPDGRRLVTGSQSGALYAWEAATGASLPMLPASAGADLRHIGFAPDARTLFTAHADGTVRLWDPSTGKQRGEAITGVAIGRPVRFSPDGRFLFTVASDGLCLRGWDAQTGMSADLSNLSGVQNFGIGPDGHTVVTLESNVVYRRNLRTGQPLTEPLLMPDRLDVADIDHRFAVTPDGAFTLEKNSLGAYVLGDLTAGKALGEVARLEGGGAVFGPNGLYLLTSDEPAVVRLWEVNRAAWRAAARAARGRQAAPAVTKAVFTADGRTAALLLGERNVQLWDTTSCQPVGRPLRHPYPVWTMVADPAGRRLATTCFMPSDRGGSENLVQVWDVAKQKSLWSTGLAAPATGLAFTPDGGTLAAGGYTGKARLFDAATGRGVGSELPATAIIGTLLFSPDGKVLAAGCWNTAVRRGGVQLWDVEDAKPLLPFLPHHVPPPPSGLALNADVLDAFTPDGRLLFSHGGAGTPIGPQGFGTFQMHAWDAATGRSANPPLKSSWVVRLSPDGRTLLTAEWASRTLHLRDAATGELRPHGVLNLQEPLTAIAFSPDSQMIVVGYGSHAQLWDVATALPVGPPLEQAAQISAVSFAEDSGAVVTVSADGWVRHWPVPTPPAEDLETLAERVSLRTHARVDSSGVLVYLDGPALTACWDKLRQQGDGSTGTDTLAEWHDTAADRAEEAGDRTAARWHLERLAGLRPGQWHTLLRLARLHADAGDGKEAERVCAEALRHGKLAELLTWYEQRAAACAAAGHDEAALWYEEQLIAAEREDWQHYAARAELLKRLGTTAQSEADVERAVARGADGPFLVRRAEEKAQQGLWPQAVALFVKALPQGPVPWHHAALAALRAGDSAAYRRVCAALLAQGPTADWNEANTRATIFVLGPSAVEDWSGPLRLVEQALTGLEEKVRRAPETASLPGIVQARHAYLNTKGALLCRAGRYAEAVAVLTQGIAAEANGSRPFPQDGFLLAICYQRLGQTGEARAWMDRALATSTGIGSRWDDLELQLLKDEAARALGR